MTQTQMATYGVRKDYLFNNASCVFCQWIMGEATIVTGVASCSSVVILAWVITYVSQEKCTVNLQEKILMAINLKSIYGPEQKH